MSISIQKLFGIAEYTTPIIIKGVNVNSFYGLPVYIAFGYQAYSLGRCGLGVWKKVVEIKKAEEITWAQKLDAIASCIDLYLNVLSLMNMLDANMHLKGFRAEYKKLESGVEKSLNECLPVWSPGENAEKEIHSLMDCAVKTAVSSGNLSFDACRMYRSSNHLFDCFRIHTYLMALSGMCQGVSACCGKRGLSDGMRNAQVFQGIFAASVHAFPNFALCKFILQYDIKQGPYAGLGTAVMAGFAVQLVVRFAPKSLSEELEEARESQSVILLFKFQDKLRHAEKDLKNKKLWLRTPEQERVKFRRIAGQLDRSVNNRFNKSLSAIVPIRQEINDLANQLEKAAQAHSEALKLFQEKKALVDQKEGKLQAVQKKIQDYKRHVAKKEKERDETKALLIKERLSDTNNRIKTLQFQLNRIKQDPKQEKSVKILQQTIADLERTQQKISAEIDKEIHRKFDTIEKDIQTVKHLELESTELHSAIEQAKVELEAARSTEQDCGIEQIRAEAYLGMMITEAMQKIQEYVFALVYKSAFELYKTSDREDPLEFILEYVEQKADEFRAQLLSGFAGAARATLQTSFDLSDPFSVLKIREI